MPRTEFLLAGCSSRWSGSPFLGEHHQQLLPRFLDRRDVEASVAAAVLLLPGSGPCRAAWRVAGCREFAACAARNQVLRSVETLGKFNACSIQTSRNQSKLATREPTRTERRFATKHWPKGVVRCPRRACARRPRACRPSIRPQAAAPTGRGNSRYGSLQPQCRAFVRARSAGVCGPRRPRGTGHF